MSLRLKNHPIALGAGLILLAGGAVGAVVHARSHHGWADAGPAAVWEVVESEIGRVRRKRGHRLPGPGDRFLLRERDLIGRNTARGRDAVEHAVACPASRNGRTTATF